MNIFVKKNDTVEVIVYAWMDSEGNVQASHLKSEIPKDTESQSIKFFFRRASYQDSTMILRQSAAGGERVDLPAFQDLVFRNQIDSWDIKNEEGKEVPVSIIAINELQPDIARAAVNGYLVKVKI